MVVNKGKVWLTCKSPVVEMLKLNLPLSQENICICMPSTSLELMVVERLSSEKNCDQKHYIFVVNL